MEGHFSREAFESSNYTWANPESKRIKFFVYSTHKYYDVHAKPRFDKDLEQDSTKSAVDVDVIRMKNEFISHYISTGIQEDTDAVFRENYTIEQFWRELEEIKEDSSLVHYDCFFFMFFTFISRKECKSEVEQESLHFLDGFISIHDIWEKVRDIGKFNGKPKIFFIQADDCTLTLPKQGCKGDTTKFETKRIPVDADRLIIQSSIPRKGICRSDESDAESKGSFLVEAFIEVMRENRERSMDEKMDLLSLTTDINRNVRRKIEVLSKTNELAKNFPYPQISSTFRKFLYL